MSALPASEPVPRPWRVVDVDKDGLVFEAPNCQRYACEVIAGGFEYEGMWAFWQAHRLGKLERGSLHGLHEDRNTGGAFSVSFPTLPTGPCVQDRGLCGFRLQTPRRFNCDLWFTARPAPAELKNVIEGLFADPTQEVNDDGRIQRELQPVALPPLGGPDRGHDPGLDQPEGLQGREERGGRQAGRRRHAARQRQPRREGQGPSAGVVTADQAALVDQFLKKNRRRTGSTRPTGVPR